MAKEKKEKADAFALQVKLTFTEPLLGTVPKDKAVYETYIAGLSENVDKTLDEEVATVPEGATKEEKGWTGFHTVDGQPFLYDYAIKGFFKDACSMLARVPGTASKELTAFRKHIDGLLFIRPRKIILNVNGALEPLERPLRAQTAQGERIALARSDCAPAGSWIAFTVVSLGAVQREAIEEWFDYGQNRGLGQWRNGGYGSFTAEISD
jgi:hypothetical protein